MRHKREGETLTVLLEGELDQSHAEAMRNELDGLLSDTKITHLIFDLSRLTFMDSSGIGMLLGRYRLMTGRNGKVTVKNPSARMDRIFRMSGVYQVIEKA